MRHYAVETALFLVIIEESLELAFLHHVLETELFLQIIEERLDLSIVCCL